MRFIVCSFAMFLCIYTTTNNLRCICKVHDDKHLSVWLVTFFLNSLSFLGPSAFRALPAIRRSPTALDRSALTFFISFGAVVFSILILSGASWADAGGGWGWAEGGVGMGDRWVAISPPVGGKRGK